MKFLRVTLLASFLSLLYISTSPAQGNTGESQQVDSVTLTFQLTLHGDPPQDDSLEQFVVGYTQPSDSDATNSVPVLDGTSFVLCEDDDVDRLPCVGSGTIYTRSVQAPEDARLEFEFARFILIRPARGPILVDEIYTFSEGTVTLTADTVIKAYYDFDRQQGGAGGGPETAPELPDTGAGDAASATRPALAGSFAPLLLAAGVCAVLGSRRIWRR